MKYANFDNYADLTWLGYENECKRLNEYHKKVKEQWKKAKENKKEKAWLRAMSKKDLFFLMFYVLGRTDVGYVIEKETGEKQERPWLFRRCAEIQANPDGFVDIWSRDHYKSTIITYGKTIQDILINPEITVCIYAYNMGLAKKMLKQIKNTFESCEMLKKLFPDILYSNLSETGWKDENGIWRKRLWTDEAITVKRKGNPKEATIECSGLVEGQRTGGHYNLLVYDDTVTLDSVRTSEQIKKTTEACFMAINTGSSGSLKMRFIGTRYSLHDTYSDILEKGMFKARIHPCYLFDSEGKLTDTPVLYPREVIDLKRINSAYGVFETQMLCDPKANIVTGFEKEWIEYIDNVDYSQPMNIAIICDPSGSVKTRSDFTVFWVVARTADDQYLWLDIVRDKIQNDLKWEILKSLVSRYTINDIKPHVYYEQVSMQSDIQYFEKMKSIDHYSFEITPVSGKPKLKLGSYSAGLPLKEQRIGALQPYFKSHQMKFLRTGERFSHFEGRNVDMLKSFLEEEYELYPFSKHDDGLDCMSRIADLETGILFTKPDKVKVRKQPKDPSQYDVYAMKEEFIPY